MVFEFILEFIGFRIYKALEFRILQDLTMDFRVYFKIYRIQGYLRFRVRHDIMYIIKGLGQGLRFLVKGYIMFHMVQSFGFLMLRFQGFIDLMFRAYGFFLGFTIYDLGFRTQSFYRFGVLGFVRLCSLRGFCCVFLMFKVYEFQDYGSDLRVF